MIWGLVFSYLEGRKFTDLMGSLLATSFIISSGIAKTVGRHILSTTVFDQWWMPFITASLFLGFAMNEKKKFIFATMTKILPKVYG